MGDRAVAGARLRLAVARGQQVDERVVRVGGDRRLPVVGAPVHQLLPGPSRGGIAPDPLELSELAGGDGVLEGLQAQLGLLLLLLRLLVGTLGPRVLADVRRGRGTRDQGGRHEHGHRGDHGDRRSDPEPLHRHSPRLLNPCTVVL